MPEGESGDTSPAASSSGSCVTGDGDSESRLASSSSSSSITAMSEVGNSSGDQSPNTVKDPRIKARRYQIDLCQKAMEENIVVYLGTGCGKTHIAVLLIYELSHLIRKPQKNVCIFLAPTVALVQQQAKVIEESLGFNVGIHCGGSQHLKSHYDWENEISDKEVLVMTPQVLLQSLQHCFMKMEYISLLIFDECHHAQIKSNHPYSQIMKVFYETSGSKLPRIFGMTASPVVGKGAFQQENLSKTINSLEILLNAKVYTVENHDELESFVASPIVKVYYYGSSTDSQSSSEMIHHNKLEEIKRHCLASLKGNIDNRYSHASLHKMKKLLQRTHDNIIHSLESLGLWGALQATKILLNSDQSMRDELIGGNQRSIDHLLCDRYISMAATALSSEFTDDEIASELSNVAVLKEPFFSRKLQQLIGILSNFRLKPKMKCLIFVNRIVIARSLSHILKNLKILTSWKSDFLVGVNSGLKNISRKSMHTILDKFRSGELNLLVATKVGEEGLDIQTCCLVIRFDLPETVSSFIQSRGRARMPQSEYAFLVNRGNQQELDLIKSFKHNEDRMSREVNTRTLDDIFPRLDEQIYRIDQTGASISAGSSVSLLHHYCSRLPHDEFFQPKPEFFYVDDLGGTICRIVFPSNAPLHQIISTQQPTRDSAKKDACLKAIEELHKLGVLNSFLLPESNDEEFLDDSSDTDTDSDNTEGRDNSSREGLFDLHEMLVPRLLKDKWDNSKNRIDLYSYYIKFVPVPVDREYRCFGLFLKSPISGEGERMEIDLHLAHHRSVYVNLVAEGIVEFNNDEIRLAELFQEAALKVILECKELIPEFVPLGTRECSKTSISTFYLLLPVNMNDHNNTITVDWMTIRTCLSSPIFKSPSDNDPVDDVDDDDDDDEVHGTGYHLQLADGIWSADDVKNSLIFATHSQKFFFVVDICRERNGHSLLKDSNTETYAARIQKKFDIEIKHPDQPLLTVKPLPTLHNLLHNRKLKNLEPRELEEYFIEVCPELCQLKIKGFSRDIGSSLSLLPSVMHRLENLLVAIELKDLLSASFPEAADVAGDRILEALTTEKCQERFSLERLEVLGDSFLKFVVSRRLFLLFDNLDEGELTRRRSNIICNSNLFKLAIRKNLQVYIRDQALDPCQFFAFGHSCRVICDEETGKEIHSMNRAQENKDPNVGEIRCSKGHHWLHKKTIADVVEALVGAFIIDSGFKGAISFLKWIGINVDYEPSRVKDACVRSNMYVPLIARIELDALENLLGYNFLHKGLLLQAFVHPSYNGHGGGCYQRLEYLGDAVLDYLITSYFVTVYPNLKPGQLTDLRALSVNNKTFANVAVNLSLDRFLLCESDHLREAIKEYTDFLSLPPENISQVSKCPKVLGDLIESFFGAILIESGFDLNKVWRIMIQFLDPVKNISSFQLSSIRDLLELCSSLKWDLEISKPEKAGPHCVQVKATKDGSCLTVSAIGQNKKDRERKAAELMIAKLKAHGCIISNPLEKLLKDSTRMEARLIGYDEEPVDVTDLADVEFKQCSLEESFEPAIIRHVLSKDLSETRDALPHVPVVSDTKGVSSITKTAKSLLRELCVAKCWKPPEFECCEEAGPGHLKSFAFKVIVLVEDRPDLTLECYGASKSTKKSAAEDAAQAALWFLKHSGHLPH